MTPQTQERSAQSYGLAPLYSTKGMSRFVRRMYS
jgi:hypothetical protein